MPTCERTTRTWRFSSMPIRVVQKFVSRTMARGSRPRPCQKYLICFTVDRAIVRVQAWACTLSKKQSKKLKVPLPFSPSMETEPSLSLRFPIRHRKLKVECKAHHIDSQG